ncbi:oligosaccharyl transferase subunit ost3/OST6 [Borealophlyctis nickersoniae]|nr:oligosaccharyl transferase subunit ost3/OST6 [Borealophlyctis nickersoniae]
MPAAGSLTPVRALVLLLLGVALLLADSCTAATVGYKVKKLEQLQSASPYDAIKLDGQTFNMFTEKPRNYSIVTVLTSLAPEHGCEPCKALKEELKLVTAAWTRTRTPGRLYFGVLEYKDGMDVFRALQLTSVPMILHFPPTEGPFAKGGAAEMEMYDSARRGFKAEDLAVYIETANNIQLSIRRPIDYTKYAMIGAGIAVILVVLRLVASSFLVVVQNKKIWTVITLGVTILMCSGHMWNSIRTPPYTGVHNGRPQIVSPGFQQQFVIESQIAGLLYASCAIMVVALTVKVPAIQDPAKQRYAVYVCTLLFLMLYSALLSLFKLKNGGYPFKLFF